MNRFSITIENIQHIKKLEFTVDLVKDGLMVIVGKNGVGKTMLFKGIQNLITSTTFANTSNKYIYHPNSQISYEINDGEYSYLFKYDTKVGTLDYKGEIDAEVVHNIYVELPIPFGDRFNRFQKLGELDREIRLAIISKNYSEPTKLIAALNYIYDNNRFDDLKEIVIKNEKYYVITLENDYYIREDYLSSGEYFILSIYKLIEKQCKFIAIDEIDISLDAMAQVRFVKILRELTSEYHIKLLFSTHSLALIKTLKNDELFYMDLNDGVCSFEEKSYNYIKSLMYGFLDYDKYMLTEDAILKDYMEYLLQGESIFSKYIILPIAGAGQVVSLMDLNHNKKIFESKENVISVLDGDMSGRNAYNRRDDIYFLPFESIEKYFFECFNNDDFGHFSEAELRKYNLQGDPNPKQIYSIFIKNGIKSQNEIFTFLSEKKETEVDSFKQQLIAFLNS